MEIIDLRVAGFPVGTIPSIVAEKLMNPLVDLSAMPANGAHYFCAGNARCRSPKSLEQLDRGSIYNRVLKWQTPARRVI